MTDPKEIVVYESSEDWSALYYRGKLVEVGDHYWVNEKLLQMLGIQTIQSDDFLRGGNSREDVAKTLEEIDEFQAARDLSIRAAEAQVIAAQEKLDEAKRELDRTRSAGNRSD